MQRLGQPEQPPTADAFRFELEDRIQCLQTGRLSYKRSLTNVLAMDIPLDATTNKDELEDFQVNERPDIRLHSSLCAKVATKLRISDFSLELS